MDDTYLQSLLEEKDHLDPKSFPHAIRLVEDEILRVSGKGDTLGRAELDEEGGGEKKPRYRTYAGGIVTEEVVKLSDKVVVPVKEYPKFNFVGKLLGPRGNTLKRLQQSTQTRMSVLGRGSTRDKAKEEELRNSDDPKHEHLKDPLHVLIEVEGPKSEAHARLAAALAEIQKYMVPENDEIRQEQMREMALLNSIEVGGETSGMKSTLVPGRGRPLAPIIRVGIPPPGAIILNGAQATVASVRGRAVPRIARGRGGRQITVPRHASTAPEYYDTYDTFDATYEGYPETSETVYYEYPDDYPSTSTGRREKRPARAPTGHYGPKKYRVDPYADVTYPSPDADPYRSSMR